MVSLGSDRVTVQVLAQPLLERFQLGLRVCLEKHPTSPVRSIADFPPGLNSWDFTENATEVFKPVQPGKSRGRWVYGEIHVVNRGAGVWCSDEHCWKWWNRLFVPIIL